MRVWFGLVIHFTSAIIFVYSKTKEVNQQERLVDLEKFCQTLLIASCCPSPQDQVVAGEMYLAHFAVFGMIFALMVAELSMYQ